MTLLSICTDAIEEIGEYQAPGTIVGNTDPAACQLLALAKRELKNLARCYPWKVLTAEQTFTMTTGQSVQTGAIPSDFWCFKNFTWWDRTNEWRLRGPSTSNQWQVLRSGIVQQTPRKWIRVRGSDLLAHPNPDTADTVAFEYVSKNLVDSDGDGAADALTWAADTDTSVLDEDLLTMGVHWRYLRAKGLPYADEKTEYDDEVALTKARDGGHGPVSLSGRRTPYLLDVDNVPDSGFGG